MASKAPAEDSRKESMRLIARIFMGEKFADCLIASISFILHLDIFFSASFPDSLTCEFSERRGISSDAPISTAWRRISSNTELAGRHIAKLMFVFGAEFEQGQRTFSKARVFEAEEISQRAIAPFRLNIVALSPLEALNEPQRWRLSASESSIISPAVGGLLGSKYALNPDIS